MDENKYREIKRLVEMGIAPPEALHGHMQGMAEREQYIREKEYEIRKAQEEMRWEIDRLAHSQTPASSEGTSLTIKKLQELYDSAIRPQEKIALDKWKMEYPRFAPWEDDEEERAEKQKMVEAEIAAQNRARQAAAEARARKKAEKRAKMLEQLLGYAFQTKKT